MEAAQLEGMQQAAGGANMRRSSREQEVGALADMRGRCNDRARVNEVRQRAADNNDKSR